jgi:hypothetical protein
MPQHASNCWKIVIAFAFVIPAINFMAFFEVYRQLAFKTIPTDPYQELIIYYAGDASSDYMPPLYMLMRPLSAILLVPFYHWLPNVPMRLLPPGTDLNFLRASAALAAGSLIGTTLSSFFVYWNTISLGRTQAAAAVAALLVLPLMHFVQVFGVDPMTVAIISLIIAVRPRLRLQILLTLLSVAVNEKIAIVIGATSAIHAVSSLLKARRVAKSELYLCLAALLGFAAYLAAARYVSGHAGAQMSAAQFAPSRYIENAEKALRLTASAKGAVQILAPSLLVLGLFAIATRVKGGLQRLDILVPVAMYIVAAISDVEWNIGRITFLVFTIPLPFVAQWIVGKLSDDQSAPAHGYRR